MTEFSLTSEIIGALIGISGLNVGVIMIYIRHLHEETKKDIKELKEDAKKGHAEHRKLWNAVCNKKRSKN